MWRNITIFKYKREENKVKPKNTCEKIIISWQILYYEFALSPWASLLFTTSFLTLKEQKNVCTADVHYKQNIQIQNKFYQRLHPIVPRNTFLISFSYHYYLIHPKIELPWPEKSGKDCACHTEPLDKLFQPY